jgi:MFS family permease
LWAIAGFGIATLVFGLSTNIWISVIALFFTGAFDSVSVVIRQTVLRFYTPDEMRGRVSSVNGVFVSTSNEMGAFESGVAAKFFGTVPSVLMGAGLTLVLVTWVAIKSGDLFNLKIEEELTKKEA